MLKPTDLDLKKEADILQEVEWIRVHPTSISADESYRTGFIAGHFNAINVLMYGPAPTSGSRQPAQHPPATPTAEAREAEEGPRRAR